MDQLAGSEALLGQYVNAKGHFMFLSTLKVLQFLISAIFNIIVLWITLKDVLFVTLSCLSHYISSFILLQNIPLDIIHHKQNQ